MLTLIFSIKIGHVMKIDTYLFNFDATYFDPENERRAFI